jgi:hypothetical protein
MSAKSLFRRAAIILESGEIITGRMHCDCYDKAITQGKSLSFSDYGFEDHKGHFVPQWQAEMMTGDVIDSSML